MDAADDTTPDFDIDSRVDPPAQAGEQETLLGYLRYHRNTFRWKVGGLTEEKLATTLPPSEMTLGGMLKHLALVEENWFSVVLHGEQLGDPWTTVDWDADPDWDWHSARTDAPGELARLYETSVAVADAGLERTLADGGLDSLSVRKDSRTGEAFSLRWILTHMVEEYARHNGHADLIRQSIDGQTGE